MPAALANTGETIPVAGLSLYNPSLGAATGVQIASLLWRASDRYLAPLALGSAVAEILVYHEGDLWAQPVLLAADDSTAVILPQGDDFLVPGQTLSLDVMVRVRSGTEVDHFRLGLGQTDIGVAQPAGTLFTVNVQPAAGSLFPFWTEVGNFSAATLAGSYANFPNPFAAGREVTTFAFTLPSPGAVSLRLLTGHWQPVATLLTDEWRPAGLHQVDQWDGRNGRGVTVQNGVYVAELVVQYENGTRVRHLRKVAVVR
jgi:hypothetical protein